MESRTDALGLVTSYTYDELRRIKTKSYSDSTPDVTYSYYLAGSASAPDIGQIESITSSSSGRTYSDYDELGRYQTEEQEIAGNMNTYTFGYTHWLTDEINTLRYPSGRLVTYGMDDAGRTNKVRAGGKTYANLSSEVVSSPYAADGRLAKMKLGNGLWETRDYRTPGVTTTFMIGTSSGAAGLMSLGYSYSASANNGNLTGHVIRQPGKEWTQSFEYDALNRLSNASEAGAVGFGRTYGYDRYGNGWVSASSYVTNLDIHEPTSSSNFSTSTNRINVASSTFDDAGNQTFYTPFTLTYDAENRLISMSSASIGSASFLYDGEGRRVKKVWTPNPGSTVTTYYVYDATGNVAAEYSDQTPGAAGTSYVFTDMLGSVRGVTNSSGTLVECYDYLPFGRMLSSSDNGRNTGCYPSTPDSGFSSVLPNKFTGKEREGEIPWSLDFFGARYMSAAQERFMSPDPLLASARLDEPQTWNRYAYARNSPLRFIDPDGLYASPSYDCNEESGDDACLNDQQRRILENSKMRVGKDTLSGKALWDALGKQKNGETLQNAFVNVTDRLASVSFGDGLNALSQLTSISAFASDRIFANVNSSLMTDIQASALFTSVSAGMHGEYNAASFKDWDRPLGNVQFSFARSGTRADIDIDIGNMTNGLFGMIVHGGEVIQNKIFKTTTNQDAVRNLLVRDPKVQTITPSPDPRWNRR